MANVTPSDDRVILRISQVKIAHDYTTGQSLSNAPAIVDTEPRILIALRRIMEKRLYGMGQTTKP